MEDGEAIKGATTEEVEVMATVTYFINLADGGGDEFPV